MQPERTVQQHLVVRHGTLGFEVGQPHPAILGPAVRLHRSAAG